jgi:hypothetical protein
MNAFEREQRLGVGKKIHEVKELCAAQAVASLPLLVREPFHWRLAQADMEGVKWDVDVDSHNEQWTATHMSTFVDRFISTFAIRSASVLKFCVQVETKNLDLNL